MTEGEAIQIKIRGKGGTEEEEQTLLDGMMARANNTRRRDRRLIHEQVRQDGQTVPCTVTWDNEAEQKIQRVRGMIQDYLELFKLRWTQGLRLRKAS